MLAGIAFGVVSEIPAAGSERAGSGPPAVSCWSRSPLNRAGRSCRRKSCPITCTCSCRAHRCAGVGGRGVQRSYRTCSAPRVSVLASVCEGVVFAVVFRRLGRICFGVDGPPLHRAPMGCGGGVRRAHVFRLRPTVRQHVALGACADAHRGLYNAALQEHRDAWAHSKIRINYGDQSAQLTEIRRLRPDQALRSFSSQQATLRR